MLDNFFRINLPYGIAKSEDGKWMAFNREYRPIGFNGSSRKGNPGESYQELNVYTNYGKIKEDILLSLADDESDIRRDDNGEITKVFFYGDATNPVNQSTNKSTLWDKYFLKLQKLSRLEIK